VLDAIFEPVAMGARPLEGRGEGGGGVQNLEMGDGEVLFVRRKGRHDLSQRSLEMVTLW
jgi:hypothetical protein